MERTEPGLLSGMRVVEAASMIMVPSTGAVLADYGAQVVKIEPLEGDLNRRGHHIPGMPIHETDYGYCFLPDNRGKRSLSLDLKAPEAKDILRRLVKERCVLTISARMRSSAWDLMAHAAGDHRASSTRMAPPSRRGAGGASRDSIRSPTGRARGWRRTWSRGRGLGPIPYGRRRITERMALLCGVLMALRRAERSGRGTRFSSLLANGACRTR